MNRIQLASVLAIAAIAIITGFVYVSSTRGNLEVAPASTAEEVIDMNSESEEATEVEVAEPLAVPPVTAQDSYIVYQETVYNEDGVRETKLYRYPLAGTEGAVVIAEAHPDRGGVWSKVIGQQVYVRRFSGDADALVSLDSSFVSVTSPFGRVSSADGTVWADYALEWKDNSPFVSMNIQNNNQLDNNQNVVHVDLIPADLGITLGYAEPFLVSDDGKTIYVRQIFEGEACDLNGLWTVDTAAGEIRQIDYLLKQEIRSWSINPTNNVLIGTSYERGEPSSEHPFCGPALPPSSLHIVDLRYDHQTFVWTDPDHALGSPTMFDDGNMYAYDHHDDLIRLATMDESGERSEIPGTLLDVVDRWMVIDRDGELVLYHLDDDREISLGRSVRVSTQDPDYAQIDYVGAITIK